MSRRVTLYIGGLRCDLPDESPIQFTWTREDLDNPTTVRNSYTHQLTLPGTPANDAVFGRFGRVERTVKDVPGQTGGPAFNPLKKAPFVLYSEDATVLARGYAKLDSVLSKGEQAVGYRVSLYGGLGSLFYDLTYDGQGEERSLADLIYKDANDADIDPRTEGMSVDRLTVAKLWGASIVLTVRWGNVLTFAPCYNGYPEGDFDANKAIVAANTFYNFPLQTGYRPLDGSAGDGILATFQNKHTEWEVRDFRSYLQRPAVSVKAVLEALADPRNTGEWSLVLGGAFFSAGNNPWYDEAWMTLPMLARPKDGDWTALHLADALKGSMTPAAFLIGYAKQFGLVFDVDEGARVVTLMARDDYYAGAQVHDLSERIDIDTIEVRPCNAAARWYEMKVPQVDAAFTKDYADDWGRVYGSQRIDTGWEFDSDVKDLLPGFPFRGAADVLEAGANYYVNFYAPYAAQYGLAMVDTEQVKYKLYDSSGNAADFDAYVGQYLNKTVYRYGAAGFDAFPKVQMHGADGKASDGSGVLLIRTGEVSLPGNMSWHTSDDSADMLALNDGRPCWYIAGNAQLTSVSKVPSFRRMAGAQTMDFGAPRETAVPGEPTGEGASIYYNRWKGYLTDRLDRDTKVLTAKVDWRRFQVGAGLLRCFYWYRNSLWSLNKIRNYAPTLDALTECEFVQVRDRAAYDASQLVPAMASWYLNVSPASLVFDPAGQALALTITANVSWTLTVPSWITASALSGTGNATVVLTAAANGGAARSGTVSLSGAHATSASASASQATAFTPSLSVSPNNRTYDDKGRTLYYTVTCNGRWRVRSISAGWITCTSSGTGNGTATVVLAANGGSSSRTAYIMWEMTDYPGTTFTTYITQNAQAATLTYALELSKSAHTIPASGGSYDLTVQGVTYTNGVETARTTLNQSALAFSRSGSNAISRSGLTFSGADLAFVQTAQQQAVFTITWSANGAQATFTVTQEANVRSVIARQEDGTFPNVPSTLVWNASQVNEALAVGDFMVLDPTFHYEQTVTVTYTSRPGEEFYEEAEADVAGAVQVVSGTGLSVSGSGTAWRVDWAQNTGGSTRSGVLKIKQTGSNPYYPGYFHEETRSVTQAAAGGIPSKLLIQTEGEGGTTVYVETQGKTVFGNYVRWDLGLDQYGHPAYCYTDLTPAVGEYAYNESTLTTRYGYILSIVY